MKKKIILATIFTIFLSAAFINQAQALKITLKRVVFEGPKRAEVLTVINNTEKEQTYRLGWRHLRMTPESGLEEDKEGQNANAEVVDAAVKFAPRRFTLQPNTSQQVRMVLRVPGDLPDGEYRSHFWVRPEADVADLKLNDQAAGSSSTTLKLSIEMLAGVTMPVFIRKGAMDASVSIHDLQANSITNFFDVKYTLERQGNKSVYGDVDYVCNHGDPGEYLLKTVRGVAVYTDVNYRKLHARIEKQPGAKPCNTLSVTFTESSGYDGEKIDIMAQEIVKVN
ncbi:MAG TPA: hypothetical protein PLK85_02500 [Alphaproteobacteria bacterium]|nr:hypothetical protein [Alphaproteobacteria bacterium]